MPAKSSAYEKGIREGRAMAARSRNPEASEPEEEEEEEEMDMEGQQHSRKRSAKGAKHTKPAKDGGMYGKKPMDAECACGKKSKCDGNCSYMRKRRDSLTPIEYLDACELGIQDRSTAYIRARLDSAERLDLKCGKGAISEGEKCTKGAAQKVQPKKGPRNYSKEIEEQKKIMQANDFSSWRKANKLRKPTTQGAFDKQSKQYAASKQGATLSAAWKKQNELKKKRTRRNMGYAVLGGAAAGLAAMTLAKRRDSVYATGFSPESDALAL